MGRKSKICFEDKLSAVLKYKSGRYSYQHIASCYGVDKEALRQWVVKYDLWGADGLRTSPTNAQYNPEFKQQVVADYLSGEGSYLYLSKKYGIVDKTAIKRWVKCHISNRKSKERNCSGTELLMRQGRETTQEERIDIVAFCLENNKNYGLATEKYKVSYQQVYSWVKKYENSGIDGLIDRRGKRKTEDRMSPEDKLRQENKILRAELKQKEMEIAFAKKLWELERGGC